MANPHASVSLHVMFQTKSQAAVSSSALADLASQSIQTKLATLVNNVATLLRKNRFTKACAELSKLIFHCQQGAEFAF